MAKNYDNIHWLPDEEYKKAVGQLHLQMTGVFNPFTKYGQDIFIPSACDEAVKL